MWAGGRVEGYIIVGGYETELTWVTRFIQIEIQSNSIESGRVKIMIVYTSDWIYLVFFSIIKSSSSLEPIYLAIISAIMASWFA